MAASERGRAGSAWRWRRLAAVAGLFWLGWGCLNPQPDTQPSSSVVIGEKDPMGPSHYETCAQNPLLAGCAFDLPDPSVPNPVAYDPPANSSAGAAGEAGAAGASGMAGAAGGEGMAGAAGASGMAGAAGSSGASTTRETDAGPGNTSDTRSGDAGTPEDDQGEDEDDDSGDAD